MKQNNAGLVEVPAAARGYSDEGRQQFLKASRNTTMFFQNPPLHTFISQVSRIPQAIAVSSRQEDNTVHVWTIIEAPDKSAECQVYDAEMKLMENFPEGIFDFHTIFLSNRNLPAILPTGSEILYVRE